MIVTRLKVFEEVRFISELLIAQHIFAIAFARKRDKFLMKSVLGFVLLNIVAITHLWLIYYLNKMEFVNITLVVLGWYLFLTFLSILYIFLCYKMSFTDTLFIGIAGYAAQHIEYVLINEIVFMGLAGELMKNMFIYVSVCILSTIIIYLFFYKIFAKRLRTFGGQIYEESLITNGYFLMMLGVLLASCFMCQNIFRFGVDGEVNYLGAIAGFFNCTLVLVVQYSVVRISTLNKEKEVVKQLLYERKKQYQMSKENIDAINRKCHDLKHQMQALKSMKGEEREKYIQDVEDSIMFYDNVVKTDNEVLSTILSEKNLYCKKHRIKLTCIVDNSQLDFMDMLDVYALFGNMIDNAIESVMHYENKEKRVISLVVSAQNQFLCIQTNNYCEKKMRIENGTPITTKKDKNRHGFGMKSIRYIAEKYNGSMYATLDKEIFMLQIVIPIQE